MGDESGVREHAGYVYFIRARSVNRIKIGFAEYNPDGRFNDINIGSPVALEKFALMRGPQSLEAELHARFKALRKKGEWFRAADPLMAFIAENARDWREYRAEEAAVGLMIAEIETKALVGELRRVVQQTEDHASLCYINGIDPDANDASEQLAKKTKHRRYRYGPLQALLDKLKSDEQSSP